MKETINFIACGALFPLTSFIGFNPMIQNGRKLIIIDLSSKLFLYWKLIIDETE